MFEIDGAKSFGHTTWADFKKYIDGTYASLAYQFQEKTDYYIIITEPYAGIQQTYDLLKNAGADQIDFDNNYKNLSPRKPGTFSSQQVYGQNASGTALTTNPVTISGSDGTNVRTLRTATDGTLRIDPTGSTTQPVSGTITANAGTGNFSVVGTGTAGSSAGGVLSIQGVVGGVAVPISGTISATNPSVSTTGSTTPTSATLIGASDGTNLQALRSTTTTPGGSEQGLIVRNIPSGTQTVSGSGNFTVIGSGSAGTPATGVVTIQGITSGTAITVSQATASSLRTQTASEATSGGTAPTVANLIGASDGTNIQTLRATTTTPGGTEQGLIVRNIPSGTQTVSGSGNFTVVQATAGNLNATVTGTVTANAGTGVFDITPASPVATDYLPVRLTSGTAFISDVDTTFTVTATAVATAANKSMFSIANGAGSSVIAKIYKIYLINAQATAVTGVVSTFELRRFATHSAGTLLTTVPHDTTETLNASIECRTGATIATESTGLIRRFLYSNDEFVAGTLDADAFQSIINGAIPVFDATAGRIKPITLRASEGLTVKHTTATTLGVFDVVVVFTQV